METKIPSYGHFESHYFYGIVVGTLPQSHKNVGRQLAQPASVQACTALLQYDIISIPVQLCSIDHPTRIYRVYATL